MNRQRDITQELYSRRLPHWHPEGRSLFITFRLFGSLPAEALERLRRERECLHGEPFREGETPRDRALRHGKRLFGLTDLALAEAMQLPDSPKWLSEPEVAGMVCESIHYRRGTQYHLLRYTVMPNHVHLLIRPLDSHGTSSDTKPRKLPGIMHSLKSYTAQQANRLLGRTGPFWQDESFDHWVRDEEKMGRIISYIDNNPVQAGLCGCPGEWPWCSTADEMKQLPVADESVGRDE